MNQYPQNNQFGNYHFNPAYFYSPSNGYPQTPPVQYNYNNYVYPNYPPSVPQCPPAVPQCPPTNAPNFELNGSLYVPPSLPPNQCYSAPVPPCPPTNPPNCSLNNCAPLRANQCYPSSVPPCPAANSSNFEPNRSLNVPASLPPNQYPYGPTNSAYYGVAANTGNYNAYQKPPEKPKDKSNHQNPSNNYDRLPSPNSFIRECKSGKKSSERLSKEEMIKKDLKRKPDSPENSKSSHGWRSRESHDRDSPTSTRRDTSYQKPRSSFNKKQRSEEFLKRWRLNNCNDEKEWEEKMEKLSTMDPQEILKLEEQKWTRTTPAELYYTPSPGNPKILCATKRCTQLSEKFKETLVNRSEAIKATKPAYELPPRKLNLSLLNMESGESESEKSHSDEEGHENEAMEELKRKQQHPDRLHPELWYNEKGELNDGPLCRCSRKARKFGIRHNIYNGENALPRCDLNSNNADKLYHYRITISPPTNFLINTPTIIKYDDHEFIFEGFSLLSHFPLESLPACKVIRFNLSYTILYVEEKIPDNFTIWELDLFYQYFFKEILELVDFDLHPPDVEEDKKSCPIFHFMPRFVRDLPDNGREILSMCHVLRYLIDSSEPLINDKDLPNIQKSRDEDWQETVKDLKGSIVTKPSMKPCSIRIDQLDRDISGHPDNLYPDIIHFGIRPPQLSYAGSKKYQRLWRTYVKFRHLLANMPKPSMEDKLKLHNKEMELQKMRCESKFKRGVTVVLSSDGFYKTGIMCDIVQHAMLIPVLVCHLRFHRSLDCLEKKIGYKFKNRCLLQLALTHPSYRENFGTNPDHVRNVLTNCGIRQPEYGDRRIHYLNTRKRGINTLINIMSRFGNTSEKQSSIMHNERLEFLGDAVIEFVTSIHLFHLFPEIEEGGLATYRAAIVQNQHLTIMAQELELHQYMLFAHGSDLCHDLELRHAMANCFEALLGALYLDGGIDVADKVFSETYFAKQSHLFDLWHNYPLHPIQEQEPDGDRKWISTFPVLQKLTEFEDAIGVEFKHIRLLARAFTDRSIGFTNLTLGSNQRLEFLGDTILQLICSLYLYKHFPDHHEGHLSLLRSSLVNNKTQAVVCDDLGMSAYAVYANPKDLLKVKDRADLLEAFLGALYIDKGMKYCEEFCNVCFFPRLQYFIMRQDWNDPKSKLQQCCLTLRSMEGREPDIPVYKVIECKGPTNGRTYTVAVYFKGQRLAAAHGHNIQQAEMNAASKALENSKDLFPHLEFQKRAIYKSIKANKRDASSPDVSRSKRYYR